MHAISGLDIALWDIRCKLEGVSVAKLRLRSVAMITSVCRGISLAMRGARVRSAEDTTVPASAMSNTAFPPRSNSRRFPWVAASRITERGATRADDRFTEAAMEDRKKEGYF